jgi:hypothetical protein
MQDFKDSVGDVFVFAGDQAAAHLEDGDLTAEATEHLAELKANVASADDDQMLGQGFEIHQRAVVEVGNFLETVDVGRGAARPPTSMKMRGAVRRSAPTLTTAGDSKRA